MSNEPTLRECRQAVLRAVAAAYPARVSLSRLMEHPEIGARMFTDGEVREAVTDLLASSYVVDSYDTYPAAGHTYIVTKAGLDQIRGRGTRDPMIWGVGAI